MASSKLRRAGVREDSELAVDMSPMIDMVFLLLIFFIVNATAIIVKTDPKVKPPIASFAKPQDNRLGRIVINIRDDGTFTAEDFNITLPDDVAIFDLVKKEKDRMALEGITAPKLHLRGHKDAVFSKCRTVIRAASRAGVDQVVFAVFVREP